MTLGGICHADQYHVWDGAACVHEAGKWVLKDEPYYLVAFKNPLEALRAIEAEEFAVVIADQCCPK